MTHRPQPHIAGTAQPLNLALGVLLTASLLGCAQQGSPGSILPADAPRALVYGAVSSPILEALRGKVAMTPGNGSQTPGDYDLVIMDGDAFRGPQLKEDVLIREAVRSGVWVLGLDMVEDDKREGLGDVMGASTPNLSEAYLIRRTRVGRHFKYTIMDLNDRAVAAQDNAQHIIKKLSAAQVQAQDTVPATPPSVMLHASYEVTQGRYDPVITTDLYRQPGNQRQRAGWEVITTIDLYLDNDPAYRTQGPQQWAVVQVKGNANPNQLLSNDYQDDADIREVAWYQTQFAATIGTPGGFQVFSTSPRNVNGSETVTTGSTFSIGASGGLANGQPTVGVTAGYTYTNSTTHTITDWQVRNDSTSNLAQYRFASNNPTNGLITSGADLTSIDGGASPKEPNTLSLSNLQYQTLSVFQTARGATTADTVQFAGADDAWYTDVWRYVDDCGDDEEACYYADIKRYNNHQPWSFDVNMGQVYPVMLADIQVNGNADGEVTAGQRRVPVVITLKDPAPADLVVGLSMSNQDNFTFADQPEVTIQKGDTSGTFYVHVAENSQGQNSKISAFYTSEAETIISVKQDQ